MTKFYITVLMMACAFSCHAQISQIDNMNELIDSFKAADSKTLVIFDVDMVLIQPSDPAFQMANMKRFSIIAKRIMKQIPTEKQMMFLSLMTIGSAPVLIEECTPELILTLIHRNIPVMAMTANLTGSFGPIQNMEEWRINTLQQLGIDFTKSAPCKRSLVFDDLASYRGNYSTFRDGVLFVNGTTVSKGEAFLSFLEKSMILPEKIIFIDDREDNLKNVEAALQKLGKPIEYYGFHYIGAQHYPSTVISEGEFESKWQDLASQAKLLD